MTNSPKLIPPKASEFEVSIFGRGFGEAVLVHMGDGRWVLVDCLRDQDGEIAPLRYLRRLGFDPAEAIKLIVATHWHDDHVAGLSVVYQEVPNALLALPTAMKEPEVRAFIARARDGGSERITSGVLELDTIATIRSREDRKAFCPTKINTVLLRLPAHASSHGKPIAVEALSPSNADVQAFLGALASSGPILPGQRVMPFDRNDTSVALWISIGEHRILLGADLENSSDMQCGWHSILHSPAPVEGRAEVVKVPHHGSANGHNDLVWERLLSKQPIAAVTTWNRGTKLPTETDVERLLKLTSRAYITTLFDRRRKHRPAAVERTIREMGANLKAAPAEAGQIRLKLDMYGATSAWCIELLNNAQHLSAMQNR